ncbi:ankyrin repeat-containing protein [Niveomyces insectorum RCEF 264]|uniref:Ankyrin repeat-containing protein n=1 Tax=Niveomyces insectorum RCEF 264 TaxID=1081102 RepID=A0A167W4W7_9HYPO|nr:ankyrin repeat-containing protein [Niveomyces insectorum RCEF 264]
MSDTKEVAFATDKALMPSTAMPPPSSSSDKVESPLLKTTKDGIVLVPQPSDDPDDPLNWNFTKKHAAMFFLALESLLVKFSGSLIAPGAHRIAIDFHVTPTQATYIGSAQSILYSIAPIFWIPVSHRIGRRPVLLMSQIIAMISAIGVARSQTYAQAMVCRMIMGFGGSGGLCIGPAAISDMFFLHEKGSRMGINSILLVVAPYVGGVAGGSIQQNPKLGWRWSMYVAAICYAFQLFGQFFFVPETIYEREVVAAEPAANKRTIWRRLGFRTPTNPTGETYLETFSRPFAMFVYPAVVLPSFWVSVAVMTEVANTAGFALNFGTASKYHFTTAQVGYCYFAGFIGALAGELCAGPLCDFVVKRTLRKEEPWRAEKLLKLSITGLVTLAVGLIIYGVEYDVGHTWAAPLSGILLFVFGQEILVTVIMTYMCDCYPEQAAEVSIVFQFFFNVMCFHPPFYTPLWIQQHGAKVPYIVYGLLPVVLFPVFIVPFMLKGEQIRSKGALFRWSKKNN